MAGQNGCVSFLGDSFCSFTQESRVAEVFIFDFPDSTSDSCVEMNFCNGHRTYRVDQVFERAKNGQRRKLRYIDLSEVRKRSLLERLNRPHQIEFLDPRGNCVDWQQVTRRRLAACITDSNIVSLLS